MAAIGNTTSSMCKFTAPDLSETVRRDSTASGFFSRGGGVGVVSRSSFVAPIKAMEASETTSHQEKQSRQASPGDCNGFSGKSTVACALGRALHARGKLTYILDGDNCRHGLNKDLSFKAGDRAENIRRIGEVAKLFADAGVICIASLISPFRKERDACRNLLPEGDFIEVYMDVPIEVCETRDPKGLYKLARAGKIKGFTGVDDPYEPPLNSEIVLQQRVGICDTPCVEAEKVVSYLEKKGYLEA